MPTPQRLPIVNSDDGVWGDILRQYILKEHYDDGTDNAANGGHKTITIQPGTASAGTAPLKFTSGTLLTAPEAGAIEFNSDKLYFTKTTGPTRQTVATYDTTGSTGDIYYRDSSSNFVRLAVGSTGDMLTVSSGLPAWSSTIPNTATVTVKDANFTIQDDGDTTKQVKFQASGLTTATTRTLTVPDASTTLVGTDTTDTLTNKTLTTPKIGTSLLDSNGNTSIALTATASAVNYLTLANAATGGAPLIDTVGSDTNIQLNIRSKGTGAIVLRSTNGNGLTVSAVASSVNYVNIYGNATGQVPTIQALGTDTNISLNLVPKGTGTVQVNGVDVVTTTGTQTLTNKTLTAPKVDFIKDTSGNNSLEIQSLGSANWIAVQNKATGSSPSFVSTGSDTDIGINFSPKGNESIQIYTDSGVTPTIRAASPDTNVDLNLITKGTGVVKANGVQVATTADVPVLNVSSGKLLYDTTVDLHPESSGFNRLPHIINDIAYNSLRGGSVVYKLNGSPVSPYGPEHPFQPDATEASTFGMTNIATDVIVAEVVTHTTFEYGNTIGIVMTPWCAAKDVTIEIYDPVATSWISIYSATNDTSGNHWANADDGGSYVGANGFSKIRYTLSNFISSGNFRITQMYVANYASELVSGTFLPRGGGSLYGTNALPPSIAATGSDTNIGLTLHPKGSDSVTIYADSGHTPTLHAGSVDTNVDLNLITEGTGVVKANGNPVISTVTGIPAVTGTPDSTTYLRGDGTWSTPAGGSSGMLAPVQAHTDGSETYTISGGNVTQISGTTIQGYGSYSPSVGDRILILTAPASSGAGSQYNITTQPGNGIYVVTSNTTNLSLSRASDMSGSYNPAGLSVYSENTSLGWLPQTIFTVTTPSSAASFTYGSGSIRWGSTSGRSLLPDNIYVGGDAGRIGFWNNTPSISTYLYANSATPGGGTQSLTLPATVTDTIVARTSTDTLTNKRITKRVNTVNAPGATPTIATDSYDGYSFTGINANITSMTSGLTGTPTEQQSIILRFKDDGTARTITWGASWRAIGVILPTTTVLSKTMYVGAYYNATDSIWDVTAVAQET